MTVRRRSVRRLVGKRVRAVRLRPADDGRGGRFYRPIVEFEDGISLEFGVQETDCGEYGVEFVVLEVEGPI